MNMKQGSFTASHFTHEQGSALIGVIVAMAALLIVVISTMSLTKSISEASAKARFDNDIVNDLMEIRLMLGNETVCTANLKGRVLTNELSSEFLLNGLDTTTSNLNAEPLVPSKILKGFKIRQKSGAVAALIARFEAESPVGGQQEVFREISLAVDTGPGNAILKCSTNPLTQAQEPLSQGSMLCHAQGGALLAPFYNPSQQCKSMGEASCKMAGKGCLVDQTKITLGGGYTACMWNCKFEPTAE